MTIRKGYCYGCPFDYGAEATEMAYNLGCLPSANEASQLSKRAGQAWACHENPDLMCCGYAAENRQDHDKPLYRDGTHGEKYC